MHSGIASLEKYGASLIGKYAQSTVLTMIGNNGSKIMQPLAKITAYSIEEWLQEPVLMLTIDGEEVFESTLCNIQ